MVGKLIEKIIGYKDVQLPTSKVTVSGRVVVREGKVYRTEGNIVCKWENENISFRLNQSESPQENMTEGYIEPKFSTPAWPPGLSADATVEEFKQFVQKDIM